jgi:hypothetical protein
MGTQVESAEITAYMTELSDLFWDIYKFEKSVAYFAPNMCAEFAEAKEALNARVRSIAHLANAAGRAGHLIPSNGIPT